MPDGLMGPRHLLGPADRLAQLLRLLGWTFGFLACALVLWFAANVVSSVPADAATRGVTSSAAPGKSAPGARPNLGSGSSGKGKGKPKPPPPGKPSNSPTTTKKPAGTPATRNSSPKKGDHKTPSTTPKSGNGSPNKGNNKPSTGKPRGEHPANRTPRKTVPGFPDAKPAKPKTPVQGGDGMRKRWKDPHGNIYEEDRRHDTVEKYDKRGRHQGEHDPDTGRQTKPRVPGRKVEP